MKTILNIASLAFSTRSSSRRCVGHAAAGAPRGCDPSGRCGGCDLRCDCGSLLARLVGGEVELKCRRCKRTWRIPVEGGEARTPPEPAERSCAADDFKHEASGPVPRAQRASDTLAEGKGTSGSHLFSKQ
jgi:hypothetical protein